MDIDTKQKESLAKINEAKQIAKRIKRICKYPSSENHLVNMRRAIKVGGLMLQLQSLAFDLTIIQSQPIAPYATGGPLSPLK